MKGRGALLRCVYCLSGVHGLHDHAVRDLSAVLHPQRQPLKQQVHGSHLRAKGGGAQKESGRLCSASYCGPAKHAPQDHFAGVRYTVYQCFTQGVHYLLSCLAQEWHHPSAAAALPPPPPPSLLSVPYYSVKKSFSSISSHSHPVRLQRGAELHQHPPRELSTGVPPRIGAVDVFACHLNEEPCSQQPGSSVFTASVYIATRPCGERGLRGSCAAARCRASGGCSAI